jgi:hypothetical protein
MVKRTDKEQRRQEFADAEDRMRRGEPAGNGSGRPKPARPRSAKARATARVRRGEGIAAGNGRASDAREQEAEERSAFTDRRPVKSKARRSSWLWTNWLELATVSMIQGEKGSGKSTWMRAVAADVTGGPRLPGMPTKRRTLGGVLWFAGEEDLDERVWPCLEAAGADLDLCHCWDDKGEDDETLRLPGDCDRLIQTIQQFRAVFVMIDPFLGFCSENADVEGGSIKARVFMRQIRRVAHITRALIVFGNNLTKDQSKGALAAGRASGEIANTCRSILHTHQLPQTTEEFGLASAARNNGPRPETIRYTIVSPDGPSVISVKGKVGLTADELVSGEDGDLDRSLFEQAKRIVQVMLPSGKLAAAAFVLKSHQTGISIRTLQRAAKSLGVTHVKDGTREGLTWYWVAPKGGYK